MMLHLVAIDGGSQFTTIFRQIRVRTSKLPTFASVPAVGRVSVATAVLANFSLG
jgi:hypothetical protein